MLEAALATARTVSALIDQVKAEGKASRSLTLDASKGVIKAVEAAAEAVVEAIRTPATDAQRNRAWAVNEAQLHLVTTQRNLIGGATTAPNAADIIMLAEYLLAGTPTQKEN